MTRPQRENRENINYAESSDEDYNMLDENYDVDEIESDEDEFIVEVTKDKVNKRRRVVKDPKFKSNHNHPLVRVDVPLVTQLRVPISTISFVNDNLEDLDDPYKIYLKLFEESLQLLFDENDVKFREYMSNKVMTRRSNSNESRRIVFNDLTLKDIYSFVGCLIYMDVYPYPEISGYWGLGGCKNPLNQICKALSYSRFNEIREILSISDVNILFQNISNNCKQFVHPSNEFAVDEMLRLFKGRYSGKISIPSKPAGVGVKSYLCADSNSKLPTWYSVEGNGNGNEEIPLMQKYSQIAASMSQNGPPGSTLFVDNLYNTYELMEYCKSKNRRVVGTVRTNNLPKALKPLWKAFKSRRFEHLILNNDGQEFAQTTLDCEVYKYGCAYFYFIRDNGCFVMATNSEELFQKGQIRCLSNLNEKQKQRFGVDNHKLYKVVPYIVSYYNHRMNSVDIIDQYISSHERHQKQKKWKSVYLYTALKMSVTTSYQIFKL